MTADFRKKLRQWFTSMLVMFLIVALSAAHRWFVHFAPDVHLNGDDLHFWIGVVLNPIETLVFFLPLLILWHFSDFAQAQIASPKWLQVADKHAVLVLCLCIYAIAALLIQTRFLDDLGCPERQSGFDGCGSFTPWWKILSGLIAIAGAIILTAGKLLISIWSNIARMRQNLTAEARSPSSAPLPRSPRIGG